MTKTQLREIIKLKAETLTNKEIDAIVAAIEEETRKEIKETGTSKFLNLGTFKLAHRKERNGRNPITGDSIVIPAKNTVTFKASKDLKSSVN